MMEGLCANALKNGLVLPVPIRLVFIKIYAIRLTVYNNLQAILYRNFSCTEVIFIFLIDFKTVEITNICHLAPLSLVHPIHVRK